MLATAETTVAMATGRRAAGTGERLRRCIATGASLPRQALLRFVLAPDGTVTPDVAARLPGRGVWLTPSRAAIDEALKNRLFARAFRGQVRIPDGLAALVEGLLVRRLVDTLGLARRAGQAVAGAARVEEWFDAGRGGVLVLARDAGEDARRRWRAQAPRIEVLSGEEIGRAFARGRTAQAVVADGPLGRLLIEDAGRLAGLRPDAPQGDSAPQHWDNE